MKNKKEIVLCLLRKIPKGKVTTYKELAKNVNTSPRVVGQIMKNNKQLEKYPCFKVIKSDGSIGGYCGKTNGKEINKKILLLRKNGIEINNNKIDLKKYLYKFE
ncbi:MAG: MGMT family protein [Candidatus Aenigmatarchaeota archaeon]